MARRTFRYDPALDQMVEIDPDRSVPTGTMVIGDVPAFVSPLDGSVVEGRRAYYEHMKRHNVVPFETGDEKRRPPPVNPAPRREAIWEAVDRSIQQYRRK